MAKEKKEVKRWSRHVMETSNALDLEKNVFLKDDPHQIALSLKRSAEKSTRRKSSPYRSAMSMLTFYINRAGKNLPKKQVDRLQKAKDELRELYGREKKTTKHEGHKGSPGEEQEHKRKS